MKFVKVVAYCSQLEYFFIPPPPITFQRKHACNRKTLTAVQPRHIWDMQVYQNEMLPVLQSINTLKLFFNLDTDLSKATL